MNALLALDLLKLKALQKRRVEVLIFDMLIFHIGKREIFKLVAIKPHIVVLIISGL